MTADATHRRLRCLAGTALGLAVLASFAGSPYTARHASIDVALLAHTVEQEEDHVTALELAEWIKERRPGLRVLDVRTPEEYEAYHVPTAEHLALDSLTRMPFRTDETLVLYSEGGAHAAQAWVFLRALGYRKVFFLRGGLYEWLDQVMNPRLADTSVAARGSFARASIVSRYFGGVPRSDMRRASGDEALPLPQRSSGRSAVPLPPKSTASTIQEVRRRGC